jgi:hypothetical protein
MRLIKNGASTNWSGYAVETNLKTPENNAVSAVSGNWIVPTVTCSGSTTYSSFWVGIDGYSDNSVEQTGTEQDCQRHTPSYYAWYEMYPRGSVRVPLTVAAGNVMSGSVTYSSKNTYTLTITDTTTGKSFTTSQRVSGDLRQSAEWIAEAPSSYFGVLPLSNFGTVNFSDSSATINGLTGTINNATWQNDPITMLANPTTPKATPSALFGDGTSFSVAWSHS